MNNKILVIGSINQDLVVFTPQHPKVGETILGNDFRSFPGGKGANQAVAAAKLGGNVQLVGCVGKDAFGQELVNNLHNHQVDTSFIKRINQPTGIALITVDKEGQNSIVVVPAANSSLRIEDIDQIRDAIKISKVLVLQMEIPLEVVIHAIDVAYSLGVTILLNPAPAIKIPSETLRKVTYLIPNESELGILTDMEIISASDCHKAAETLFSQGCQQIILTRGEHGAYYFSPDLQIFAPPFKVTMVDSTAAGDAFIGGFAVAIANNLDLQTALLHGSAAGALTVTRVGAQTSLPGKIEFDDFLNARKNEFL